MRAGGWAFTVQAAPIDETPLEQEAPRAYVRRLAESKARSALLHLAQAAPIDADTIIVAADTTVVDTSSSGAAEILGKPIDDADAMRMLRQLAGRAHQVFTGVAVLRAADGRLLSEVDETEVWLRAYTEAEMQAYVSSGYAADKAGAYAIQHAGLHPVERWRGCYANVMGLPLCRLAPLLEQVGGPPGSPRLAACRRNLDAACPLSLEALA